MSAPRVRYSEPPQFVMHYPTCSACDIDLDYDGDSWECPKCATQWDSYASDGDDGTLWADHSGEDFPEGQQPVSHDEGMKVAWIEHAYEPWLVGKYDMGKCRKCYHSNFEHIGEVA